jgi:hypothetical protein
VLLKHKVLGLVCSSHFLDLSVNCLSESLPCQELKFENMTLAANFRVMTCCDDFFCKPSSSMLLFDKICT